MSIDHMKTFRDARKAMGFTQTSAYIPHNRLADFSLYVDRLKAERMLELCENFLPTSGERQVLAGRNLMELPSIEDVKTAIERHPEQPVIKKQGKELIEQITNANAALITARLIEEQEDFVKWMSIAVAHNHMANVIWREMMNAMQQVM